MLPLLGLIVLCSEYYDTITVYTCTQYAYAYWQYEALMAHEIVSMYLDNRRATAINT